jgi:hypothetical protein
MLVIRPATAVIVPVIAVMESVAGGWPPRSSYCGSTGRRQAERIDGVETIDLPAPEDLVQHCFGVLLGRANDECKLRNQDLSGLCQHPLLSLRQAFPPLPKGEVPDDLGHMVDVAGDELGQVRPVPLAPQRSGVRPSSPRRRSNTSSSSSLDTTPRNPICSVLSTGTMRVRP